MTQTLDFSILSRTLSLTLMLCLFLVFLLYLKILSSTPSRETQALSFLLILRSFPQRILVSRSFPSTFLEEFFLPAPEEALLHTSQKISFFALPQKIPFFTIPEETLHHRSQKNPSSYAQKNRLCMPRRNFFCFPLFAYFFYLFFTIIFNTLLRLIFTLLSCLKEVKFLVSNGGQVHLFIHLST